MENEIDIFYQNFMGEITSSAYGEEDFCESQFVEKMYEILADQCILPDDGFQYVGYKKESQGIRVDAWVLNPENNELALMISDFKQQRILGTLIKTDVHKMFKRLEKFVESCKNIKFVRAIEESSKVAPLVSLLYENISNIRKIKYILLSNSKLSERIPDNLFDDNVIRTEILDINRCSEIANSTKGREDIAIDFTEISPDGISCLTGSSASNQIYTAYLFILPGDFIAKLYDQYLDRLLEQNVRTFLQFRGKINKGICNTIMNEPKMFFAYNNGLTATADDIQLNSSGNKILSITNLQIVNGGQTTASIFTVKKERKVDLSDVYVQVKLTVITDKSHIENIVPDISKYANTQNKVNAADFFSNHPYHLRIEEMSRRLSVNPQKGKIRTSYWYYERIRGQYNNALANKNTLGEKKSFKSSYPKDQKIEKVDLAKFIYSWEMKPMIVSLGGQKCFSDFADKMGKAWSQNDNYYNERYFKELIAKAIIFKSLDKRIKAQSWYSGDKAQIITYTMAKISYDLSQRNINLDFMKIWEQQCISDDLIHYLTFIAEKINTSIRANAASLSVSEWCKRQACWEIVKVLKIVPTYDIENDCIDSENLSYEQEQAVKKIKQVKKIHAQVYVVEKDKKYWSELKEWIDENRFPHAEIESGCLREAYSPRGLPSEKQAKILINLEERAAKEGFHKR